MNKIMSVIKEDNLVFHVSFLTLLITNVILWGWLFHQFIIGVL